MKPITVHIEDHSQEVLDALENAAKRAAGAIGQTAVRYAKQNIKEQKAYDTGRLWNSITYQVKGE